MKIFKKYWFWIILIFVIVFLIHFVIKLSNTNYCSNQEFGSYEYFDEDLGFNVTGCPHRCNIGSCFGARTACCPKGLGILFES